MTEKGLKILVAVDEGEESAYALSWCLENLVNGRHNSTIVLLYTKQPSAVPAYAPMDSNGYMFSSSIVANMERYTNHIAHTVMEKAQRICDQNNHDQVIVEKVIEYGDPRDVICEVATKLKVDFLVMGSRGYGAIKRAFLGSVSTHCAQNVKCPVMIVKKPA